MQMITKGLYQTPPPYIPIEEITARPIKYVWDSEMPFGLISEGEADVTAKLVRVSSRGIIAYSIGCTEWVVYRMSKVLDNLTPYYYLEAFWAYVMGHQDLFDYPPELDHIQWASQEEGPIDCAISSIMNVIYLSEHYSPPAGDAARIAMVARHVLSDDSLFSDWEKKVLDRLVSYCPRMEGLGEGDPIPRQLLDSSSRYDDTIRDRLIGVDLENRDFSDNPFFAGRSKG